MPPNLPYFVIMKTPLLILAIAVVTCWACTSKKSKEELARLDRTSPETFIQSIKDFREDEFADSGNFTIEGHSVYSSDSFMIVVFRERLAEREKTYSIIIGSSKIGGLDTTASAGYADIKGLLRQQNGYSAHLTPGSMSKLEGGRIPQFALETPQLDGQCSNQELIMYNGTNGLFRTPVRVHNSKSLHETLRVARSDTSLVITAVHQEDSVGKPNITFTKTWELRDSIWYAGLIMDQSTSANFNAFTKRFTYLEREGKSYFVPENCQSGGPIYFELKHVEYKGFADFYVISSGIEDSGFNIVFQIDHPDESTFVLHKIRGEGPDPLHADELRVTPGDEQIIVKADPTRKDIYMFTYSYGPDPLPYTIKPSLYQFVSCK